MRNPLVKRYKRELKEHFSRYFAILTIFVLMVFIISGFLVTAEGVRKSYEEDHILNKVEDGQFTTLTKIEEPVIEELESLSLTIHNNYYVESKLTNTKTIRIFQIRKEHNIQTLWEGELPVADNEIAIDRLFAKNNHYTIGDHITLNGKEYKITAIISLPDYSSLFIDNTNLMMDAINFGVAIVSEESFSQFFEEELTYNYSYLLTNSVLSNLDKLDISEEMKKILIQNQAPLRSMLLTKDNQSISFVGDDMGSDIPLIKSFLYILQIIMTFVFTIIISSSIESDASVIGTLFASGYRKKEMMVHYLTLPAFIIIIGAILGNILSYTLGIPLFKGFYYGNYSLPPIQLQFHVEAFLLTTILPLLLLLGINALILHYKLSLSPLKFLRRDLSRKKQRRSIKLPNFNFMTRFHLRVILQNKGNYFILSCGVLFASFILLFGICMGPTIEHHLDTIKESTISQYQYILKSPDSSPVPSTAEKFSIQTMEIYSPAAKKNFDVAFYGIVENSQYWEFSPAMLPKNSVFISDGLAKKLNIKVGDEISLSNPQSLDSYNFTVYEIVDYAAGFSIFISIEEFNRILEKETTHFSGYLSDNALSIPKDNIAMTITADDLASVGDQMLSTFLQMSVIFLIASIIIYFVLFYVLTKIIVDKNTQDISFMKVMGYRIKEIRRLYLTVNTFTVLISLLLSMPIIYQLLRFVFVYVYIQLNGYVEPYIPMYSYMGIFALGLCSYFIINRIHVKRIQKINMGFVLKNRE